MRSTLLLAEDCNEDERISKEDEATPTAPSDPEIGGDAGKPSACLNLPLFTFFLALLAKYPSLPSSPAPSSSNSSPLPSSDDVDSVSVPSESDLILYLLVDDSGRRGVLDAGFRPTAKPGDEGLLPACELDVGTRTEDGILVGPILVIVMARRSGMAISLTSIAPSFVS